MRVLQCYFLLLFIIVLCVFVVCIFGVFVYAYVLFSVLWAQLPEFNNKTIPVKALGFYLQNFAQNWKTIMEL